MGACVQKAAKAYWDFCPGEFHEVVKTECTKLKIVSAANKREAMEENIDDDLKAAGTLLCLAVI